LKILFQTGIVFLCILVVMENAFAGSCATPEEIMERKLSENYDWTVNDKVTLKGLLSVKQLYAVRIMNYGEFVSCHYAAEGQLIRLDGLPNKKGKCLIEPSVGEWVGTDDGDLVCQEKDISKCQFKFECAQKENEGID